MIESADHGYSIFNYWQPMMNQFKLPARVAFPGLAEVDSGYSITQRFFTQQQSLNKKAAAGGGKIPARRLDPRKDFKFFIMKAKVCQVYREALLEARGFGDPETSEQMIEMVKHEFRVFRRRPEEEQTWRLDVDQIDYQLAVIRKQINMIKELRDRVK